MSALAVDVCDVLEIMGSADVPRKKGWLRIEVVGRTLVRDLSCPTFFRLSPSPTSSFSSLSLTIIRHFSHFKRRTAITVFEHQQTIFMIRSFVSASFLCST